MSTSRRGQVWTSAQLRARLAALRGLAPAIAQHAVYRVTTGAAGTAAEGYLVPGEARRLTAAAFDFWLAKGGLAGPERLSVAVLVVRERLATDGTLQECELEYRRGAADGPYCGSPSRVTFNGPAQSARFFQATPEGEVVEVAPMPGAALPGAALPGAAMFGAQMPGLGSSNFPTGGFPPGGLAPGGLASGGLAPGGLPIADAEPQSATGIDAPATMRRAVLACCGEAARILDTRAPTVIEAMVGISSVLLVLRADGRTAERTHERGDGREVACGILWHGPIAIALQAEFPRFDVAPTLSAQQSAALAALTAREGLIACETRRDEHGLAVVARRPATGDAVLVRFEGATASLAPYQPVRATEATADQAQWLHYIENYEGLGVLDSYRDGTSDALIVLTGAADGAVWRHHVDSDGIETWRRADSGSAAGALFRERIRYGAAQADTLASAHATSAADSGMTPFEAALPGVTPHRARPSGRRPTAGAPFDPASFDPGTLDPASFAPGSFDPGPFDLGSLAHGSRDAAPISGGARHHEPIDIHPVDTGPIDTDPIDIHQFDADPVNDDPIDASPFGPKVEARFPTSAYDIDEAARCLALRRSTASVFHCLRIVEQGLRAHAHWRGTTEPQTAAGRHWTSIMSDLRGAGPDNELFATLDAVRRAWRDEALQVGAKYTEEEAARIFRLVEGFMRCLVVRCDEDGDPVAPPVDAPC